ncbi:MAG: response regulator transcription factor, partial [Caulobacter sp.]|nr:response regulator transcription factor [Caulobacter sp.]
RRCGRRRRGRLARGAAAAAGRAGHRHRDARPDRAGAGPAHRPPRTAGQGGDRDHLRPQRFPAPRAGGRRGRLPAQGRAGAVADGEGAWREVQRLQPDVLVTDIEMPGLTGLELAQRIARHELPVKVVIVTTFARSGFLRRALEAGVVGYLLKDAPAERLAEALRKVRHGGRAIDPELAVEAWGESDPLNDRERQVLRLAGEGHSSGEIATRLNLSQGTVRNYLS